MTKGFYLPIKAFLLFATIRESPQLLIKRTLRYLSCQRDVGAKFHMLNARDCENTNYIGASRAGGDDTLMLEEASLEL